MMRNILLAAFAALLLGLAAPAIAQETAPTIAGAKTISPADAKSLIEKGAQVFDVRRRAAFLESHLPKAKSVASAVDSKEKTADASVLGENKAAVVIIHGHGTDGWSAVYLVEAAVKAGYTNVNWMRGGFAEWSDAKLPLEN